MGLGKASLRQHARTRRRRCEQYLDSDCFLGRGNNKEKCCAVGMRLSMLRESKSSRYRTETGERTRGGPCPAERGPALLSIF